MSKVKEAAIKAAQIYSDHFYYVDGEKVYFKVDSLHVAMFITGVHFVVNEAKKLGQDSIDISVLERLIHD